MIFLRLFFMCQKYIWHIFFNWTFFGEMEKTFRSVWFDLKNRLHICLDLTGFIIDFTVTEETPKLHIQLDLFQPLYTWSFFHYDSPSQPHVSCTSQPPHTVLHWYPWYCPQPRAGIKSNNKDTVIVRRGWPSVLLRNDPASKRHCHRDSGLAKACQCSPALIAFIYNLRHETSAAAVPLSLPSTQRVHINVSTPTCTEVQLAGGRHLTLLQ